MKPGECVAVVGASGSGKSLFLRMIADLDLNHGEVRLGGCSRGGMSGPQWRRQVIYVAAESGWWADNVAGHFEAASLGAAGPLAGRLGLRPELLGAPVSRLSSGEGQRLALVRALVRKPRVLLLDEPTSSLDPDSVRQVEALLEELLAEGLIVVLVTHDVDQASRLAERRFLMHQGHLASL